MTRQFFSDTPKYTVLTTMCVNGMSNILRHTKRKNQPVKIGINNLSRTAAGRIEIMLEENLDTGSRSVSFDKPSRMDVVTI